MQLFTLPVVNYSITCFVSFRNYHRVRSCTRRHKLLFLCFFCVKNERAKYYIFRWLCITLLCKVYFFFLPVAGRRKKNKGYGQMLLYLLGASKMTMLYVITNVVAAIAGKALIVAKVALAIATAIGLKRILGISLLSFSEFFISTRRCC